MNTTKPVLPERVQETLRKPGISPDELHALNILPIGRNALYEALRRGEIENFRLGKKIVIPTAPLRRRLGLA